MLAAIAPVRSLLLSIFVMMAGAGFMSTLVGIRLTAAGAPAMLVGAVATAYFAGLAVGALKSGIVISAVGHIRAFVAFASLLSATTLAYALVQHPLVWAALRFADGLCVAGVYVCLESWLNARAEPRRRGSVLAAYMIALYAGQALGQFLLNIGDAKPSLPFAAASILISLAVIPVALTRGVSPAFGEAPLLPIPHLFAVSPLGVAGVAATGVMMGGFYGLGAVFTRLLGLDVAATATFMSAVIFGGVALQWPVGWLSDQFDRRKIITLSFAGVAVASGGIALYGDVQADRKHHGGLDQAVYAYSQSDAEYWAGELGRPLAPGFFGENLRIDGLDVNELHIGDTITWVDGAKLGLIQCLAHEKCVGIIYISFVY